MERAAQWCSPGLGSRRLDAITWIVIDLETTGLDPARHQVREFAALVVAGSGEIEETHSWIGPQPRGSELAACLRAVADRLDTDAVVVAHNLAFDTGFLAELGDVVPAALAHPVSWLCSMRLTGATTTLDALAARAGVTPLARHTAVGDATTLANTLKHLAIRAREHGSANVGGLAVACASSFGSSPSSAGRRHVRATLTPGWSGVRQQLDHVVPIELVSSVQRRTFRRAVAQSNVGEDGPRTLTSTREIAAELRAVGITAAALDLLLTEPLAIDT